MATWKKILTEADKATDGASGVANGETGLVTGNAVFDYIVAQNFGSGSGDITNVTVTADDTNTVGAATGDASFTIAGGEGIDTSASGSTLTIAGEDASTSNKGVASFASADFSVSSGAVSIKSLGVSNAQLAGSIANAKLANSTISGIALGSNLSNLRSAANGGIVMTTYNGSAVVNDIALDIDGMTDIGADLVDADLIIVDDGANGTNRKSTLTRLKTYMQNGLTFTTNTDVNVSKANLTTVLASYTGSDTLNIGDADDDTTVVIRGNLQVDGTTTTINSTSLTVDDKIILCADGSSSESNTGTGGLEIEVGDSTQNPFVGFVDGAALTQMVVKAAGATTSFPIAVMEFSSDSTAPTGNAGGVGSFHFDTGDDKLYVRTA